MSNFFRCVGRWITDPFGQSKLNRTHNEIISSISEAVETTRSLSQRMEAGRFPIGSTARRKPVRQKGAHHARAV